MNVSDCKCKSFRCMPGYVCFDSGRETRYNGYTASNKSLQYVRGIGYWKLIPNIGDLSICSLALYICESIGIASSPDDPRLGVYQPGSILSNILLL